MAQSDREARNNIAQALASSEKNKINYEVVHYFLEMLKTKQYQQGAVAESNQAADFSKIPDNLKSNIQELENAWTTVSGKLNRWWCTPWKPEDIFFGKIINFDFDGIDDNVEYLACLLKYNAVLEHLSLSKIETKGALAIAKILKNSSSLTSLRLSDSPICIEGVQALGEALRNNTSLVELELYCSYLTDEGIKVLVESLKGNTSLRSLNITGNVMTSEGAKILRKGLNDNRSIIRLDLIMMGGIRELSKSGQQAINALERIIKKNARVDLQRRRYWSAMGFIMSGFAANSDHPLRNSFLALIPSVLEMAMDEKMQKKERKDLKSSADRFVGSLFFKAHLDAKAQEAATQVNQAMEIEPNTPPRKGVKRKL